MLHTTAGMKRRIRAAGPLLALGVAASFAAGPDGAGPGPQPDLVRVVSAAGRASVPAWFVEEIAYLTRGGGRWLTDNSAYRSANEPYTTYGLSWTRGVSGLTAHGRLFGIDAQGSEHDFWELYLFWNAIDGKAIGLQVHKDGTFGIGELVVTGARGTELVQEFRTPEGAASRSRHVETRSSDDERRSASFFHNGEEWQPRRTYVWKRASAGA